MLSEEDLVGLHQKLYGKVLAHLQKMHCGGTSEEGKSRGQLANSDLPGKWPLKRYICVHACMCAYI